MRLSVIGTGYLGAVHAACLAASGADVVGVDIDPQRIASLASGSAPFYEPGFEEVLRRSLASGRLRFSMDVADAADAQVHFLCVGTPQEHDGDSADLSGLFEATRSLATHLRVPSVIVGRSTVPVGTGRRLTQLVHEHAPAGDDVELAWSPEFLREGRAVDDALHPDRIVLGAQGPRADLAFRTIYGALIDAGTPYTVTDIETAELVKVAANAFLATKISFINAMSAVCEASGADVVALADALGQDARIGRWFLDAGIGYGGGCLPKDVRAFAATASDLGVAEAARFLREVDAINSLQRRRAVDLGRRVLGGTFEGAIVAILGAAFKPDSDDIRESPALEVARSISAEGADVRVHDPRALANAKARFPGLAIASTVDVAVDRADLVLHLTEWREYRELDPTSLRRLVRHPRMIDGRNALDAERWRAAGWEFFAPGRPSSHVDGRVAPGERRAAGERPAAVAEGRS